MFNRFPGSLRSRVLFAVLSFAAFPVLAAATASGCAKDDLGTGNPLDFGSGGSVLGGGASSTSGGATQTSGGSTVMLPPVAGNSGLGGGAGAGMIPADASCATGMAKADLTPVNMFIQFDRSSSMNEGNKWPQAAQALTGFFQDAGTSGLRVALRFFPHDLPEVGCTGGDMGACNVASCSKPLVPLGELKADPAPADNQELLLVQGVMNSTPPTMSGLGTPLYPALSGAIQWAIAQKALTPNDKNVVVLVTDGEPTGCETNIDVIAGLSAAALADHQIPTYAIGIQGASERQLNQIAMAGGTTRAFFAGNNATAQQDLIAALNAIRGSVLSCDFPMPVAQGDGMAVDPTKVNVNLTPSGGMAEVIGQTPDAASCANGGWYYDNPAAPTRIVLCPSTCMRAQADGSAKLDVILGCKVVPIPPPK